MKVKTYEEAAKLVRKIERLDMDITRLEEIIEVDFVNYLPVGSIPTEISEPFRITCLEFLRKQKEVLIEKLENL